MGREHWVNPHLDIDEYDPEADLMALNMGPQHPSTHGVLRIKLFLDGEVIIKAVPYPGYLHRGAEKLAEKLGFVQIIPIVDKHDYVCPMTNEQAVCLAFEKMLGIEAAPRARFLRTILAEMQRISSHLLWLGTYTLDIGGTLGGGASLMMFTFRERELILDCFEDLTGSRFHYNTHGGRKPPRHPDRMDRQGQADHGRHRRPPARVRRGVHRQRHLRAAQPRRRHDPRRPRPRASGCPAPTCGHRASTTTCDVTRPTTPTARLEVNVAVAQGGDCYARYEVRMAEMIESVRIVRALIDQIPDGPLSSQRPTKLPGSVKIKRDRPTSPSTPPAASWAPTSSAAEPTAPPPTAASSVPRASTRWPRFHTCCPATP